MIYEFRRAFTVGGRLGAYKALMADAGIRAFERHGVSAVGFFDVVVGPGSADQLPYLLRWESFDERTEKMAGLSRDPEWVEAVARAEESSGPLLVNTRSELWQATHYRPDIAEQSHTLYEYRTSLALPNKKPVIHWRNAEYNVELYEQYGVTYVAAFDAVVGNSDHVHYFLAWESLEQRAANWQRYLKSPRFREVAEKTGPLTSGVPNEIWAPTHFSPIMR